MCCIFSYSIFFFPLIYLLSVFIFNPDYRGYIQLNYGSPQPPLQAHFHLDLGEDAEEDLLRVYVLLFRRHQIAADEKVERLDRFIAQLALDRLHARTHARSQTDGRRDRQQTDTWD